MEVCPLSLCLEAFAPPVPVALGWKTPRYDAAQIALWFRNVFTSKITLKLPLITGCGVPQGWK